jgi:nitrile hydratase accessory protein
MFTQFEEFAVSSLTGTTVSPPKSNGKLTFQEGWTQIAFAIAIDLSKQGYFEWEDFRQGMINAIGDWEKTHELDDRSWSYYKCWTDVLESLILKSGLVAASELDEQIQSVLNCKLSTSESNAS